MTATTLTADQRASKVVKITALLAKTEANGCTPGEVAAAREAATRLMSLYGIAEAECQPVVRRRDVPPPSTGDPLGDLFRDMMREAQREASREQAAKDPATKQREARAGYHKAGVHIDDASFDEGCACRPCMLRREAGPVPPESSYQAPPSASSTGRRNTSHRWCDHEATSTARARCRKARGY